MTLLDVSLQLAEHEEAKQREHIAKAVQEDIRRMKQRCSQLKASTRAPVVMTRQALESLSRPKRCVVPGEAEHQLFDVTDYAKWAAEQLAKENNEHDEQASAERQRQQAQQQQLTAWRQNVQKASQSAQQAAKEQRLQQQRRRQQAAAEVQQRAAQQLMQYTAAVQQKRLRAAQIHTAHTAHFTSDGCPGKPHDVGSPRGKGLHKQTCS